MGCAVLFPGQGSQVPGMGEAWRAHPAWDVVERAEAALGQPVGRLLLDAGEEQLARTENAQLAVLLASLVAWEAVREVVAPPVAFAGHSLGQYTALVAAGVVTVEDGVALVARRAEATRRATTRRKGTMAAIVGAGVEEAEAACLGGGEIEAERSCWVANDNAPGQVVVGGTVEGVTAAGERARAAGARKVLALNVEGAFHTPLMAEAAEALAAVLDDVELHRPAVPVVSNLDARPYTNGDPWRSQLSEHLVRPVQWRASMATLVELGAESFVEVGPGGVLAGLARRAQPGRPVRSVSAPDDVPSLLEVA